MENSNISEKQKLDKLMEDAKDSLNAYIEQLYITAKNGDFETLNDLKVIYISASTKAITMYNNKKHLINNF